jgi:Pentapeptide repeats (8 copies)
VRCSSNTWRRSHPATVPELYGADLSGVDLREYNLSMANLGEANLYNARLSESDLIEANLNGANLGNADLSRTDLIEAKLEFCDLRGANLSNTDLTGADLSGANLMTVNLESVGRGVKLFFVNNALSRLMTNNLIEAVMLVCYLYFAFKEVIISAKACAYLSLSVHRGGSPLQHSCSQQLAMARTTPVSVRNPPQADW